MVKLKKHKKDELKHISIRDNYARGELAKEILTGLAMGGLIVASLALPNLAQVFGLFGIGNSRDRFRMKRAIQDLEKQKLISVYEKNCESVIEIAEKGKKRVLKYKLDELKIIRPKKWDGFWRVVSFDIPEKYKRGRDALTRQLKEMELYPLQKSVFICPFECRDEIDFIGEVFNIRKFVHYFLANKIDEDDEEYLKKFYNL